MKSVQLMLSNYLIKNFLFLPLLLLFSVISYAQPIQVANSTAGGPKIDYFEPASCINNIKIECVNEVINGVTYLYDVIVETNSPGTVMLEHTTITDIIDMEDDRWREITPTKFAFYILEPFDLQVTGCDGIDYTVLNWPDCGTCHVLHAIGCDNSVENYPYAVYISTSAPEAVVIENNWPLLGLIAQSNPRFTKPMEDGNLYIIRYANPFDLQMTNCDGQNITANYWPNCVNNESIGQKHTGNLFQGETIVDKIKESNLPDLGAIVHSYRNPALSIMITEKETPVSIYLVGITHSNIRKEIVSNNYFNEGVNEITLGELPFGLYQIIIQQGNNKQLVKYAHTYK